MEAEIEVSSTFDLDSTAESFIIERPERNYSILEGDSDEWQRNNDIKKTMLLKANLMNRMGLSAKVCESLTKENMKRISIYQERERKRTEHEEQELAYANLTIDQSYSDVHDDFVLNFFEKTHEEARSCYLNRLINMKILKPQPAKKHQGIIIFDWDDTLLCTTFLLKLGVVDIASDVMVSVRPIDQAASQLLLKAASYGDVYIVTNSEDGWVQYSAKFFMPKTLEVINEKKIPVISARTKYQSQFPTDNHRWKTETFLEMRKMYDTNITTNLICLGDSNIEIEAGHILAKHFNQVMVKTVKFKENPQPEELLKQVELVLDKFDTIFTKMNNLTVRLEKRANGLK